MRYTRLIVEEKIYLHDPQSQTPHLRIKTAKIIELHNAGTPAVKPVEEYVLVEQTIYKLKKLYASVIETEAGDAVSLKEYKAPQKKITQLEMENEILKSYSHTRQRTITGTANFIKKFQNAHHVTIMCKVLRLPRSTYYKIINRNIS